MPEENEETPKYVVKTGYSTIPDVEGNSKAVIQQGRKVASVAEAITEIKQNLPKGTAWVEKIEEPAHIPNLSDLPRRSESEKV